MPFKSEKQRRLFYAARGSAAVRKAHGMSKAAVDEMIEHGKAGKLPVVAERTKRALRRKRGGKRA